jgi:SAM-dependent methyltransferase
VAPLRMVWDSLFARSRVERVGILNRLRDYAVVRDAPGLLALHLRLQEALAQAAREWDGYDYGEGYFYQSFPPASISGLRDTAARVAAMELLERVRGRSVLEIGCNTGCIALSIASAASRVDAFDVNPHLVGIAELLACHVGTGSVRFAAGRFEDRSRTDRYDVVLSFANHSTYDRKTAQSVEEYFARCAAVTEPGGTLLFESHPPEHEGGRLPEVLRAVERHFEVLDKRVLEYGTFLDRHRTFVVARLRP